MTPSITVIIAAYNAEAIIARAIRSALEQTCQPNVIIVDDASTDNTVAVVREIIEDEPRAQFFVQSVNRGPSAARNRAIAASTTEWITPLDADDAMEPDRLTDLLALATKHGWNAVADDQYRIADWTAGAPRRRLWSDDDFGTIELTLDRFVRENIMTYAGFGRELGYIKPLIKKDFLTSHRLSYDEDMRLGEDYDLYARMLNCDCRFGLVDPRGYLAFDTPGSLSRAHRSEALEKLVRSDQRLLSTIPDNHALNSIIVEHMRLNQKKVAWAKIGEAYHERDLVKALSSFAAPPEVVGDLLTKLFQLSGRKLGLTS